ncbi:MAG: collagen-like protein [Candidatus Schekmanbacteria bacterium]|nr:collagen-like protein [Candidatus Schekmanbacteria bacterium]
MSDRTRRKVTIATCSALLTALLVVLPLQPSAANTRHGQQQRQPSSVKLIRLDGTRTTPKDRDRLEQIRDFMSFLGIGDLADLGTINLDASSQQLTPGLFALQDRCGRLPSAASNLHFDWKATCTSLRGALPATAGQSGGSRRVTQFTGELLTDVSVILADKVVFDGSEMILSDSVKELWVVATTVSSRDSEITWEHPSTEADPIAAATSATKGTSYVYNKYSSASVFHSPSGGTGTAGRSGSTGNGGLDGPDIYFVLHHFSPSVERTSFVSLPTITVTGEKGGVGQSGQKGGDGGDGARGAQAISGWFDCSQGAGYGGNGGTGANGGRGGNGGPGGDGGNVSVMVVALQSTRSYDSDWFALSGGAGGNGAAGGGAGVKGRGGYAGGGDSPWCKEEPGRAGAAGKDGKQGSSGTTGSAGPDGLLSFAQITAEEWQEYLTSPYIVSASPTAVQVGDEITFTTLNLSGSAEILIKDDLGDASASFSLRNAGPNTYVWQVSDELIASAYTVRIASADGTRTSENVYGIELEPVVQAVVFDEPYSALPGGTARLLGKGFRTDAALIYDGVSIGTAAGSATEISFTIPIRATHEDRFVRDDGKTAHAVYLDQPYPLADSSAASFTLLRHYGLTHRPSTDGFYFTNGELTDAAKDKVAADPWTAFYETYGLEEVQYRLLTDPIKTLGFYLAWKKWWSPELGSANCMGISSNNLNDYLNGSNAGPSYTTDEAAWNIMKAQGHLLSTGVLQSLASATMSPDTQTGTAVDRVVEFMRNGTLDRAGEAPIITMIPSSATYVDVWNQLLAALAAKECVADIAQWVVEDLPLAIAEGAGYDYIANMDDYQGVDMDGCYTEAWTELMDEISQVAENIGSAHALAAYMVAYENVGDANPSRIYFYDSNRPYLTESDRINGGDADTEADLKYMNIYEEGGQIKFDYSTYTDWGTDKGEGWVVANPTVDLILGAASIPFPYDVTLP